jgi:aspartate/methionine/tyrosine aminotransferase
MKKHFPSHDVLLARRMQGIAPFHVMRLLERARQLEAAGRNIVHMEVGEPDFPTPSAITAAGIRALEQGKTHYTPATGIPELKTVIAAYYQKRYGTTIDPARVIVTPGSSGALQLVMNMLINPGEQVMMTDPGYPCNRHFVRLVEGLALSVPVGPESNYQLNSAIVGKYWQDNVRALMIASPSNPVGSCLELEQIRDLTDWLADKQAFLIMDEIYQGLNFDHESVTALQADADNLFVINSFSKYFGMTGWRLGWMIVPEGYVEAADRLSQNLFLAPQTMAQYAALEAFSEETSSVSVPDQHRVVHSTCTWIAVN